MAAKPGQSPITPESALGRTVAAALDAGALADQLTRPRGGDADSAGTPGFTDLYAYATDPAYTPTDALLRRLNDDPGFRSDLTHLLAKTARLRFPEAAAASTGPVAHREIPGARLLFRESKAEADQVYVILELDGSREPGTPGMGPKVLIVCGEQSRPERVVLPEGRDGRFQLLLDGTSDLAQRLRDVRTEIYLQ